MSIRVFKSVRFDGDWEVNFVGRRWNLRIGRSQCALWREQEPICMWLSTSAR